MDEQAIAEMREDLASLEHDQWIEWSKNIASKEKLSPDRIARWKTMWVPYDQLSEEVKDQDREWANKTIQIVLHAHFFSCPSD